MDIITFLVNLETTSGLSILLHGVISLSDETSYDKIDFLFINLTCVLSTQKNHKKDLPATSVATNIGISFFLKAVITSFLYRTYLLHLWPLILAFLSF